MGRGRHGRSIRLRLFWSYTVFLSFVVLAFAVVLTMVLIRTYSDTIRSNQAELTSQIISKVDGFLSEIDTIALVTASNPRLLAYFIELEGSDDPGNHFEQSLLDGVDAGSILTNINGRQRIADRISAYNDANDYISTGILYESRRQNGKGVAVAEWLDFMKDNRCLVIGPHDDYWSDMSEQLLSVIRPLSNSYGGASYGVVEVQRRFSRLESLLAFETQQGFVTAILDGDGRLLYATENWQDTNGYGARIAQSGILGIQTLPATPGESVVFGHSSVADWSIMLLYANSALFTTYRATFIVLFIGILGLLAVLSAVVYLIADRLSRPIRKLSESIHDADLQNLRLDLSDMGQDEIDAMQQAFDTLISRLSRSVALEMKAHMLALQAQINPHFLYNTLAVISAAGYESGSEKITDICARLSSMLRYAASQSPSDITLQDELGHMKDYLELMKERYEDDFSYEILITGDPSQVKSPKLILQPLVENCFQHGFKGVPPPWHIEVRVQTTGDRWSVAITDNGSGFPPEMADEVRRRVALYRDNVDLPTDVLGGAGLPNTAVRLFLTYGDSAIFSIGGGEGADSGARIIIGGNV